MLIETADCGAVSVHFINEESEIFGELSFTSIEKTLDALRRNEFIRYVEQDKNFSVYLPSPIAAIPPNHTS